MTRRRRSTSRQEEAERRFPWRVDILVPELGLQQQLPDMHGWCDRQLEPAAWDQHGYSVPGGTGAPQDVVRFYFLEEAAARAFQAAWGGRLSAAGP